MTFLAIDQGTTSTRAILFDTDGRATPLLSLPHRQIYPHPGCVEHDPEELIGNLIRCLEAAAGIPGLIACGIDNQGESCLAWDAQTGEAVSPVLVWQDDRTAGDIATLASDGGEELTQTRAGLPLDPYFSASKLRWILRNRPRARELWSAGRLRLGTTDAFFRQRLTGHCATDPTTASRTSLMNLAACDWDDELCALFRVPRETLPPIEPTTGELGTITIGAPGLRLTASLVDQQAAVYGHGCRAPGDAKITLGTGAFALALTDGLRPEGGGALPTVAWQRRGEAPAYALDGGVYAAASAVNWASGLGLFSDWDEIESFTRPPAISRGLAFVPALSGLACPHWDRAAKGAWMGMTLDTDKADLMQAVLEGVAFRVAEVVTVMEAAGPIHAPVSIDGGMSRNPWFCRFLAGALGREVRVSDEPELTARGTAALAAEGAEAEMALAPSGTLVAADPLSRDWHETFAAARDAVRAFGRAQDVAQGTAGPAA